MAGRIRDFDWASTPLGPIARWPQSLKSIVGLMLGSPSMMSLVWGPEAIHLYNDPFTELLREHRIPALGRSAYETFARSREVFEADIAAGMAGKSARLSGQRYPVLRQERLEDAWFDVEYVPIRDEAGAVAGVLWTLKETTAQHLAEEILRTSEERHRLLIESWAQAEWETDAEGVVMTDSPSWRAYTGQTLEAWLGDGWLDAIHREDRAYAERQWREAIAVRGRVNAEFRLRAPDGGWRWTNVLAAPVLDAGGSIKKWAGMNIDIHARRRVEAALRESEERLAFLLRLSDTLSQVTDPVAEVARALGLLVDHLGLVRAAYYEIDDDQNGMALIAGVETDAVTWPKRMAMSDFGADIAGTYQAGHIYTVDPADTDPRLTEQDREAIRDGRGIRRLAGVSLVRSGKLRVVMGIHARDPREWRDDELRLMKEVAERIWAAVERVRAAAALRESEERFAQFATSSSDALWIRDADTLAMEYTSPAIQTIYGIAPDAILGDMQRWVELIVPEDRDTAIAHIGQAQAGASVTHEFRIRRPPDGDVRWIRNTDFPLRDQHGRVQRIGGIAQDITEAKRSGLRLEVLVNELQHRARNLLGVVTAIADRTVKQGGSVAAFEVRLQALGRAQALLSQGGSDTVELGDLVRAELAAHAAGASERVTIAGPEVYLRARQVQNFALALHELATNAVKYGALKVETGRLEVIWAVVRDSRERPRLALSWNESGVTVEPAQNTRRGYGTELITEALAYALQAEIDYTLGSDGVRCRIEMPV